jgi:O-antigen ligase
VSALAGRSGRYLLLYGGALLLAVAMGAVVAYSETFGGDNGPYMLLGALMAIAVAVAILLQWRIGAILLVAALPYGATINFGPVASGMKALALLTFVSLALPLLTDQRLFERFTRLWQQPLALAVLAFVLWVAASIAWASYKGEALRATFTFLGLLCLMVVVGLLERRYLVLAWACLVLSAALSVPAGYVLPMPADSDMLVNGRFGPGGVGPNGYGCLMAIVFFAGFFGLLRRHRMIAYLLAPVFFYGVFATESRTALIALATTPLLALFVPRLALRLDWRIVSMYVVGAAALAVMVLAFPAVGGSAVARYTTLSQVQSEETWNGRWANWQGALDVITSRPILGTGAGNYAEIAMEESTSVVAHTTRKAEVAGAAHNMLVSVASQLGLVGLILWLGVLFFAFRTALPIGQRSGLGAGIFLGLIVFMIAGMTLTWETNKAVYVLFGSVLALQLHDSARRAPPPSEREGSLHPLGLAQRAPALDKHEGLY